MAPSLPQSIGQSLITPLRLLAVPQSVRVTLYFPILSLSSSSSPSLQPSTVNNRRPAAPARALHTLAAFDRCCVCVAFLPFARQDGVLWVALLYSTVALHSHAD
ncbi:hypothetical protein IWX90DRAFT_416452 [Phyllosticta citrichinensis]|uniref:Uncharacterized protein n=1 Tax=Phyllosticta citrichinensis TaxID=1130410 RepID=A0ABR1XMH1_9PEZI